MPTAPKPSIPQRSSLGRTAASRLAAAGAATTPATAPTSGVAVQEYGSGPLVVRGAAKTPDQIVNEKLVRDCWKETPRGIKSRSEFEAFIAKIGGRVVWLNLDGGGLNFVMYLPAGKGKREIRVQGQYKHGQDHFALNSRRAEGFGLSELFYVGDDGNFVAQYARGGYSPVLLRVTHAAPGAAFSIRALVQDLGALTAFDALSSDKKWVECTYKGVVRFGRGSQGWAVLDKFDRVQKSLVADPSNAAATPFFDPHDEDAPAAFVRTVETALLFAAGQAAQGARASSPFVTKTFQRRRDCELGPFETHEAKAAAEAVALKNVEALQSELLSASSLKALAVAATEADPHLRSFCVEPLACVAEKAATPKQAVMRLKLKCMVRPACKKQCLRWRGACTCKLDWKERGNLVALQANKFPITLEFEKGKGLTLEKLSDINERLKPASGNGGGLSLVRKAARAAVRAGWKAPPELASVTRAQSG